MARRPPDPKAQTLRQRGCLHPHAEQVTDELFADHEFFDPRDLVQVKYEMLRRVRVDGDAVSRSAARFGLSRPAYYRVEWRWQLLEARVDRRRPAPEVPRRGPVDRHVAGGRDRRRAVSDRTTLLAALVRTRRYAT